MVLKQIILLPPTYLPEACYFTLLARKTTKMLISCVFPYFGLHNSSLKLDANMADRVK